MDYNYYYAITGGFPNSNVAFDGQGETQQPVFMQSNIPTQELRIATYETVMQDIAAVFTMIEESTTSISTAMCALKQMTVKLMHNTKQLGLHGDNPDTLQQHRDLWQSFNICWLSAFQRYIDYPINDLDTDEMKEMGQIVIEFGDYVEPYGLVDYEMGIWEEEILDLIGQCIDLGAVEM